MRIRVHYPLGDAGPDLAGELCLRADSRHTAVMGSSLGGVVSFHAGWSRPEVFGQVGAMSATFGYRDDLLARVLASPGNAQRRARRLANG